MLSSGTSTVFLLSRPPGIREPAAPVARFRMFRMALFGLPAASAATSGATGPRPAGTSAFRASTTGRVIFHLLPPLSPVVVCADHAASLLVTLTGPSLTAHFVAPAGAGVSNRGFSCRLRNRLNRATAVLAVMAST